MIITPNKSGKSCSRRSDEDLNNFSGEESAMFSKLDGWLSLLSERKVSQRNIGLNHILNYLVTQRCSVDSELIQNVLPGYIETLCNGCVQCINTNYSIPNGVSTIKNSVELALLLCMYIGPGDSGDVFYRQLEICMLKQIRSICVSNESASCTLHEEDSVVLCIQGLSLSAAALSCSTVSCKKRMDLILLCENLVDATALDEVSADPNMEFEREGKLLRQKFSSPMELQGAEVEWTLSSDDENDSVLDQEVDTQDTDTSGIEQSIMPHSQPECCTSLRMKAAALDAWCILTHQQRSLEQGRTESMPADEDFFDRANTMFSCCVQSILLAECVIESAPMSQSVHICGDGRLLVLRSAIRTIGYLLEIGRDFYLQSHGGLGVFDADDIKQLNTFLFDYTREEKKKSAKGSRKRKPLLAEAIQLQEWLSITDKEKVMGIKRQSPALPKFTHLQLGDCETIQISSYAMSTLADTLRVIFKGDLSSALDLFPTLRPMLGLSPVKGGSHLQSKWDSDSENPASRCVVEKCSPLDRRRTANRRMDRMAKFQEMEMSDEYC